MVIPFVMYIGVVLPERRGGRIGKPIWETGQEWIMNRQEAAKSIKAKIETAYHTRDDYPPFDVISFRDRPIYHRYILKLIDEWSQE